MDNFKIFIEEDNRILTISSDVMDVLGSQFDNEAQRLIFERPGNRENDNLVLFFSNSRKKFSPINIGTSNEYTISNALTQQTDLNLQVAFADGEPIEHSNILRFPLRKSIVPGDQPVDPDSPQYLNLLQNAFVDVTYDDPKLSFYNVAGDSKNVEISGAGGSSNVAWYPSISEDYYLHFERNNTITPPDPVYVRGPKGNVGPEGPQGEIGPVGPAGQDGKPGEKGEKGEKGDKGDKGDVGEVGEVGERGPQGLPGPQGPKGDTGDTGPIGPVGPSGPQGEPGPQGDPGPQGPPGEVGDIPNGSITSEKLSPDLILPAAQVSSTLGGTAQGNLNALYQRTNSLSGGEEGQILFRAAAGNYTYVWNDANFLPLTGAEMEGPIVAQNSTNTTAMVRNIRVVTETPTTFNPGEITILI